MNDEQLDQVVRQLAGKPQPSEADRQVTWRALSKAIHTEELSRRPRPSTRLFRPIPVMITAAVIAALAFVVVAVQITRPTAAEAALTEMAAAAELVEPSAIPDQAYAYVRSDAVVLGHFPSDAFPQGRGRPLAYLLPQTREIWAGADGTVQLRTTTDTPRFFTTEDETAYYTAGLDLIDQIGESTTEIFGGVTSILDERTWPTNPDDLEHAIRQSLPKDHDRPESVEILDLALALIRLPDAPPPLRAAALRVIARLDIALIERTTDGGGTFTTTYNQPQPTTLTITINGTGQLLHESLTLIDGNPNLGIPPGTMTAETTYQPFKIVSELNGT